MITIRASPSKYIYVGKNITSYFLGLPLKSDNLVKTVLEYKRNTNVNEENMVPLRHMDEFNNKDIDVPIMIDMDFTEKIYEI